MKHTNFSYLLIPLCVAVFFTSCVNTKKATYFNDLNDTTFTYLTSLPEPTIQKKDIIDITVSSLNPEASMIFNTQNSNTGYNGKQLEGYLVNNNGEIQFPVLGNIKAFGMTNDQLKAYVTKTLLEKKLLVDPIVSVRIQNFKVTVLGEVKQPTVVSVPNEKISLLEAIGLAGDLTIYAKRDNVLVIREENNVKTIKRLDLNSQDLFSSPYYYLKSNDIVYVEPNKAKVATSGRAQTWLPILFGFLSFAVIVLDRVLE